MPVSKFAAGCLKCPVERIKVLEDSSKFDESAIQDGVVILFAEWSGPAHMALKAYTERLSYLRQDIPVWILNQDTLTKREHELFHEATHCIGEAFFFRKGVLVDQIVTFTPKKAGEEFQVKWENAFGTV